MDHARLFGRRLKTLRKTKKMSQAELAEKADVETQYVSQLETGHRSPSFETIISLAKALDAPVSALFTYDQDEADPKILRKRLDSILNRATPLQLKQIYRHARDVVEP